MMKSHLKTIPAKLFSFLTSSCLNSFKVNFWIKRWSLKNIMKTKKNKKNEGPSWKMPFIFTIRLFLMHSMKLLTKRGRMEFGDNLSLGKKLLNFSMKETKLQKMYVFYHLECIAKKLSEDDWIRSIYVWIYGWQRRLQFERKP